MTKLRVGGLSAAASTAIEPHVGAIFSKPGGCMMAVVELEHVERTEPGPRSDRPPSVTVQPTHLEVAVGEQEHVLRDIQRALYLQRTSTGTLDEAAGTVQLGQATLKLAAGQMHAIDAARIRVALSHFGEFARKAGQNVVGTEATLRADLRTISDGITAVLAGTMELEL